jgi:hypothetical protein
MIGRRTSRCYDGININDLWTTNFQLHFLGHGFPDYDKIGHPGSIILSTRLSDRIEPSNLVLHHRLSNVYHFA